MVLSLETGQNELRDIRWAQAADGPAVVGVPVSWTELGGFRRHKRWPVHNTLDASAGNITDSSIPGAFVHTLADKIFAGDSCQVLSRW